MKILNFNSIMKSSSLLICYLLFGVTFTLTTSLKFSLISLRLPRATVSLENSDQNAVSVSVSDTSQPFKWSIHPILTQSGSSDPENCRKSVETSSIWNGLSTEPIILANTTVNELLTYSFVALSFENELLACGAVVSDSTNSEQSLEYYTSDVNNLNVVSGRVTLLQHDQVVRLAPNLSTNVQLIQWAVTSKWWSHSQDPKLDPQRVQGDCSGLQYLYPQSSKSNAFRHQDLQTITVRTGDTNWDLDNLVLVLFDPESEPISCTEFKKVESKTSVIKVSGVDYTLKQQSPLQKLVVTPMSPSGAKFRLAKVPLQISCSQYPANQLSNLGQVVQNTGSKSETWLDQTFYGPGAISLNTVITDSTVTSGSGCAVIGSHSTRMGRANFKDPVIGHITFYSSPGDSLIALGRLRHLYDLRSSTPNWYLLDLKPADDKNGLNCPSEIAGKNLTEYFGPAQVAPNDAPEIEMETSQFRYNSDNMNLEEMMGKTVLVDLGWKQACATIDSYETPKAMAQLVRFGLTRSPLVASVAFSELPTGLTQVSISFDAESERSIDDYKIRVHQHPIDLSVTKGSPCGWASLGPEWIQGTAMLTDLFGTSLKIEKTSELSGRLLTDSTKSFYGKSIVMESDKDVICGVIMQSIDNDQSITINRLSATLDSDWISGSFVFKQIYKDTVLVEINTRTNAEELGWYVSRGDDIECSERSSQPYNPYYLDDTKPIYDTLCTPSTPELCVVGDLSGKAGNIPGDQKYTTTLGYFSLKDSAVNNTLVIYDPLDLGQRLCVRLLPQTTAFTKLIVAQNVSRSDVQEELSDVLSVEKQTLAISFNRTQQDYSCFLYDVRLTDSSLQIAAHLNSLNQNSKKLRETFFSSDCSQHLTANKSSGMTRILNKPVFLFAIGVIVKYLLWI